MYTRYPIVARALGLAAAFRPSASREQRYLAYKAKDFNIRCIPLYNVYQKGPDWPFTISAFVVVMINIICKSFHFSCLIDNFISQKSQRVKIYWRFNYLYVRNRFSVRARPSAHDDRVSCIRVCKIPLPACALVIKVAA